MIFPLNKGKLGDYLNRRIDLERAAAQDLPCTPGRYVSYFLLFRTAHNFGLDMRKDD